MDSTELEEILNYFRESFKGRVFNITTGKEIIYNILSRKNALFEEFKEEIKNKWENYSHGNKRENKSYLNFLYRNFNNFFEFFLKNFFGLNQNILLKLIIKEKLSSTEIIIEYNYYFEGEIESIFRKSINILTNQEQEFFFPITYLYFIIRTLGIILKNIIQAKFKISLESAIPKINGTQNYLNFMVMVKDSRENFYNIYYQMALYYFLRKFKEIPNHYHDKLIRRRKKIYDLAVKEYNSSDIKEKITELLYYFYKKCKLVNNFCPILDFFNFICSRVEDSIFSKLDVIEKDYLANFNYSTEKKNSLLRIFQYLDRRSTLSSTFLANNLPSNRSQIDLFLLYTKYYFGNGLEALEVGNTLFLPSLFKNKLDKFNLNSDYIIDSNSIKNINNFLDLFSFISNVEMINLFFEKIFKKKLTDLNSDFFKTFFKSLNEKLFLIINKENKNLSENDSMTFDFIINHICRMLYVLIDKIFLKDNLNEAPYNFLDPRGRYRSRNIALRVLELFIFQDMNFSDDLWTSFMISWKKDMVIKKMNKFGINVSNKYFYDSTQLIRFLITYNFQSFSNEVFFENWLLEMIIIPMNNFILKIKKSVNDPKNKIELYEYFNYFMSEDIDDKLQLNKIRTFCKKIANLWDTKII